MADTLDVERNNAQGSIECPNPWKQRAEAAERICQGNGKIGEALEMLKVVQERDRLAAQRTLCLMRVSELNDENAALRAQLDAVERKPGEVLSLLNSDFKRRLATQREWDAESVLTVWTDELMKALRALTPKAPTTPTPPRETSEEKLAAMAAYTAKLEYIQRAPGGTPGGSLRGEAFAIVCHETGRELRKILTRCCKRDHNADGDCYAHLRPDRMEGHLAPRETEE